MTSVLQFPADELVEAVEEAVTRGDAGAAIVRDLLLDQLRATGELSVIASPWAATWWRRDRGGECASGWPRRSILAVSGSADAS